MSPARRTIEGLHLAILGIWFGALGTTGVLAALIFPVMRDLDPHLPAFSPYDGPHWVLTAGQFGERMFFVLDVVQLICCVLAAGTLLLLLTALHVAATRPASLLRIVATLALMANLAFQLFFLRPRMNTNLRQYWDHAAAGNNELAAQFRTAFDADHPIASRLMGLTAVLVVLLAVAGVRSLGADRGAPQRPNRPSRKLEEPMLARKRR